MGATIFMSAGLTSPDRESRRLRRDDFLVRMCSTLAWRRMILPVPDTRNRFAAARFVFIFGMSSSVLETTSGCSKILHPPWSGPRERLVGAGGIEPPTPSVSGKCSPAELSACERHPLPGDAVYTVRVLRRSSKFTLLFASPDRHSNSGRKKPDGWPMCAAQPGLNLRPRTCGRASADNSKETS